MPSKLSGASSFQCCNLPLRPSLEQITRKAKRTPIRHTSPENRNAAQSWSFFCGKCRLSEMSNALYTASVTAEAVAGSDSSARNPCSVRQTISLSYS
ncbi:hypothetical protein OIU77_024610 [Salix suchowensis]|uniref:Uncharacterized protein n=1 Tax=Salix suchowensis TaxID=1278906 RepID=A0ABQ9BTD1_9ROSI|nr:hypothetical protein OIU77_024610 [Salix suchowensis]